MNTRLQGIITPLLTPFNDDLSIAEDLYLDHAAFCLGEGVHYLSPFGTTSEATSHTVAERKHALELLIRSGTAKPEQLMPGTGLCAYQDTLELCRHAVELGCAAVMVLPPFFFSDAQDEGLYRYFSQLIEAIGTDVFKMCLYHIPQNTTVGISPALAARLNQAFPEVVVAYKDSSGKWENTRAVIEAAPGISVFPGSEAFMGDAIKLGGGGCISASCNSNPEAIRALYDLMHAGDWDGVETAMTPIKAHRQAVQDGGLITALKALKAHQTGDARWLNLRPPLQDADSSLGPILAATL